MLRPKIILEGPDNAGKTTLARYLEDATGCTYFHPGGPPRDQTAEEICMQDQTVELRRPAAGIIDRVTAISQQVYNPSEVLDPIRRAWLPQTLSPRTVVLVYCRPSNDWLSRSDRFTWRPEESEEHRQKIIAGQIGFIENYDQVMTSLPKVVYNFEETDYAAMVANHLIRFLNDNQRSTDWLRGVMRANQGVKP